MRKCSALQAQYFSRGCRWDQVCNDLFQLQIKNDPVTNHQESFSYFLGELACWLCVHEVLGSPIRNGCQRGWRRRWWWDAIWEEAAEDLKVHLGVKQGAVNAVTTQALAGLARNCEHRTAC